MPSPTPDALNYHAQKTLVPSTFSSAAWHGVEARIRAASMFAARVVNAEFLQGAYDRIGEVLAGDATEMEQRRILQEVLASMDYRPEQDEAGTIKDLSSEGRLNLILKTNTEMAQGYGQWAQGQDPAILDEWPAQELFRAEDRDKERDWGKRWVEAATYARDAKAILVFEQTGRMIALKDSGIWDYLGSLWDDSLGNPYPPFAFRSGMWVRDIDRATAISLGLCERDTVVEPQKREFAPRLEMSADVRDEKLREALLADVGDDFEFRDGVLREAGS